MLSCISVAEGERRTSPTLVKSEPQARSLKKAFNFSEQEEALSQIQAIA